MEKQAEPMNLGNLGGGALGEMFDEALQKLLADIDDPNTEAKAKRALVVKLTFHPGQDRDFCEIELEVDTKLAGRRAHATRAWLGRDSSTNRYEAAEHNPKQSELQFKPPEGGMPRTARVDEEDPQ